MSNTHKGRHVFDPLDLPEAYALNDGITLRCAVCSLHQDDGENHITPTADLVAKIVKNAAMVLMGAEDLENQVREVGVLFLETVQAQVSKTRRRFALAAGNDPEMLSAASALEEVEQDLTDMLNELKE